MGKRYKQEAKSKCDCLKEFTKTITPALQNFYYKGSYVRYDGTREVDPEHIAMVRSLRNSLSAEEEDWSQRLGKQFFDSNSSLSKCWDKRFEWENENPGNNFKYTPNDYAREMGCDLVVDLGNISFYDQLEEAFYQ